MDEMSTTDAMHHLEQARARTEDALRAAFVRRSGLHGQLAATEAEVEDLGHQLQAIDMALDALSRGGKR